MVVSAGQLERIVREALAEDVGSGDVTSEAVTDEDRTAAAVILVKRPGVVCGLEAAEAVFRALDPEVRFEPLLADADRVENVPVEAAQVEGSARALLTAGRTPPDPARPLFRAPPP